MLKQLIQRLLDSRTTPAEASHNAMPDDASISLTPSVTEPSTWQEVLAATAPTDGYVKIQATSTTSAGFIAIMQTPSRKSLCCFNDRCNRSNANGNDTSRKGFNL